MCGKETFPGGDTGHFSPATLSQGATVPWGAFSSFQGCCGVPSNAITIRFTSRIHKITPEISNTSPQLWAFSALCNRKTALLSFYKQRKSENEALVFSKAGLESSWGCPVSKKVEIHYFQWTLSVGHFPRCSLAAREISIYESSKFLAYGCPAIQGHHPSPALQGSPANAETLAMKMGAVPSNTSAQPTGMRESHLPLHSPRHRGSC